MKKFIPLVLAAAFVGLAVRRVFFRPPFAFVGTLEATRVDVPARLPTVIRSAAIEEGQQVKRGDVLFTLDCEELKIAQGQIARNYRRSDTLAKSGVVATETFEESRRARDDIGLRLSWCEVTAPIAGTVLNRYFEAGEWVQPGSRLASLADPADIWAYVYVPQPDIAALKLDQAVVGTLPELAGRTFAGKIVKINEEAEFTPKNVQTRDERSRLVFGVKIRFDNADRTLKPGMSIEVRLPEAAHGAS